MSDLICVECLPLLIQTLVLWAMDSFNELPFLGKAGCALGLLLGTYAFYLVGQIIKGLIVIAIRRGANNAN